MEECYYKHWRQSMATQPPVIDLRPDHLAIVQDILLQYVPKVEVWAYGSRVAWTNEEYSDLDLVARNHPDPLKAISGGAVEDAREAFIQSILPFRVELFDWAQLPAVFHQEILKGYAVVQEGGCGVMGFASAKLGDLIEFQRGFDLPQQNRIAGEHPIVSSSGIIDYHAESKVASPGVVTGRYGTVGKVFYLDQPFWPLNTTLWVKDFKGNHPKFVYYLLHMLDFNSCIDKSSVPGVNRNDLHLITIQIPPITEQRAIAAVLGALDDKIELNSRMNATLEAAARALFKSWFVDFDPVKAKMEGRAPFGMDATTAALFPARLTESELGDIPEGWTVKPLDEIANFLNGLALQKYPQTGDDYLPVIKIAELRQGITNNSNRASLDMPKEYIVEDGDVLFSWSGSLMQVLWTGGRGALNQHLFKVTSNYPKWFHYYWVEQHMPWFRQVAASKATTMGHIQRMHLTQAKVLLPNDPVMRAADKMIAPLFQKKLEIGMENKGLERTRDYLLPKLISGEIRIPDAEKFVEGLV
jgi:type I restriction enzyme, S subunit